MALRVQPRAPKDAFLGPQGDHLRIAIKAPPVEGKANLAVRRFIADAFGVPLSRVDLVNGEHARYKRVRIQGPEKVPASLGVTARGE